MSELLTYHVIELEFSPPPFTSAQKPPSSPHSVSSSPISNASPTAPDASSPAPSDTIQSVSGHVSRSIQALFDRLPRDHPIFGEPAQGLLRLPWEARRANGQCWKLWCSKLGDSVALEMGDQVPYGSCWMSRKTVVDINASAGPHHNRVLRKVATVRLLAFLQEPTDDNWTKLNATSTDPVGSRPIDSPFSHNCNNGADRAGTAGCINGLEHGRFATREENESHKGCTNGARALCPGHGSPPVRCWFVHADGLPKPCRNQDNNVPHCQCPRRCFP